MPYERAFPEENSGTPQRSRDSRSEFIYPYNFVPHGGPRRGGNRQEGVGTDSPFKPLHRHDGLTGRIEYTLTSLSPLFIADSEGTTIYQIDEGAKQIHRVMDFFNMNGRLCLPPTSLKGMVRSVVEAASNSSFGAFTSVAERESYRKAGNFRRQVGKWTSTGGIKPWDMAKLPLSSLRNMLTTVLGRTPTDEDLFGLQHHPVRVQLWKIHTGNPVVMAFEFNGTWYDGVTISTGAGAGLSPRGFTPASPPISGKLQRRPGPGNKRMIQTTGAPGDCYCPWDDAVYGRSGLNCGRNRQDVDVQCRYTTFPELNFGGSDYYGNNRVFEISLGGKQWSAVIPGRHEGELLFHQQFLKSDVQKSDRYARVIYQTAAPVIAVDREVREVLEAFRAANGRSPHVDEIVYYETDQNGVREFGPVAMFKSIESNTLAELIDRVRQYVYPASAHSLCPATRLFGWAPESEQGEQGIAGRVRFNTAWSDQRLEDTRLVPLKVLGSPRPKYYPFYLRPTPERGQDSSATAAYYTSAAEHPWAATPGTLRGRKFYLHHPAALSPDRERVLRYISRRADELNPDTVRDDPHWEHSHQNATCAVLPHTATFKGIIEFDSLDEYELGLLLWSLTFSNDPLRESQQHAHKLGMGKGIGLGSVRFHIDRVVIEQPEMRWLDLKATGVDLEALPEQKLDQTALSRLVRVFKTRIVTGRDDDDSQTAVRYDELPFVKDLTAVMTINLVPINVPVQYYPPYWSKQFPRRPYRSWYADEGFTYFVDQRARRATTQANNQEEPLRTPTAIQQGHKQGIL